MVLPTGIYHYRPGSLTLPARPTGRCADQSRHPADTVARSGTSERIAGESCAVWVATPATTDGVR
jgi:hypothetical protein